MSGYLINTVWIEKDSQAYQVKAGTLVTDSTVIAAVEDAGGVLASSTDATIIAAAAVVTKMRARSQNEDLIDKIMLAAYCSSLAGAAVQHVNIDVPLATIQAETSGTPFNIGAALPANAKLINAKLNVLATITGGTITACKAKVQGGADTDGSIIGGAAGVDVFTAANVSFGESTGSDPYVDRSGQQLKMTITATGDTLAHATTGHLSVDVFYAVLPS